MDDPSEDALLVRPIGWIETPWESTAACPGNGRQLQPPPLCHVVVRPEYAEGLRDLDGFSHLILLYWLHRGRGPSLTVVPRRDGRPHGVFATRAPCRPNPIALSVVAFEGFDDSLRLKVRNLDCVNRTPLVDLRPYISRTDAEPAARMGWIDEAP